MKHLLPARKTRAYLLLLLALLLPAACAAPGAPQALPSSAASSTPRPSLTHAPSATLAPAASPTEPAAAMPVPSDTPAPPPSPTAQPVITLAVPDSWRGRAEIAIRQLSQGQTPYRLRLVDNVAADMRLHENGNGVVVERVVPALAVPFASEWETITLEEAQQIMRAGHELVTVVPWREMRADRRALRVDGLGPADAGYPLQQTITLEADDNLQEAVKALASRLRSDGESGVVHLLAVGDLMLDRSLGDALRRGDLQYPFVGVAEELQEADVTVGNLESALGDIGEPQPKRYPFRAPPQAAAALRLAGFDVVSLANNHGMDYGPQALLQAIELLEQEDIAVSGAGANSDAARAPRVVRRHGLNIAFLSYVHVPQEASTGFDTAGWAATAAAPGIAWAEPEVVRVDVAAASALADVVVVLLHSGYEYQAAPSAPQQAAARAAIEAGASLVIGHHAHILQGVEFYQGGVILYGTGNFAFEIDGPPETALFHIWLDKKGAREIFVEPAIIQFGGQPRLATSWEAPAIRDRVYYLSRLLSAAP